MELGYAGSETLMKTSPTVGGATIEGRVTIEEQRSQPHVHRQGASGAGSDSLPVNSAFAVLLGQFVRCVEPCL